MISKVSKVSGELRFIGKTKYEITQATKNVPMCEINLYIILNFIYW